MIVGSIDWTTVIAALIAGLPAIIAAIFAAKVNSQIQTPSGPSIGKQVESAHLTGIANNMLLSKKNGPTKDITTSAVSDEASRPAQIPADAPSEVPPTAGA